MTVKELIAKLQAFDGDLPVVTIDHEFDMADDVADLRARELTPASYPDGTTGANLGAEEEREAKEGEPISRRVVVIS